MALFCISLMTNDFPGNSDNKNPPVMQETWVQSLDQEYPLEKGMETHSRILAWSISWLEDLSALVSEKSVSQ